MRDACAYRKLSFANLIKALNPDLYKEYQRERFHAGRTGKGTNVKGPYHLRKVDGVNGG
jgi:hypothetical protein